MFQIAEIKGLVQSFVTDTSHVREAILIDSEGTSLTSAFSYNTDKEKADITINILSLVKQFKKDSTIGAVREIIIEGQEGYLVLRNCKNDLVLLVLTSKDINEDWLFLKIKNLVETINTTLDLQN